MTKTEIRKIINSFFAFVCAACICGFIFYAIAGTESFDRYKPLVIGFGLIFFISSLLSIFAVYKYSELLTYRYLDERDIEREKGVTSVNFIGLIGVSILNLVAFNPFYPLPEIFQNEMDDYSYNQGYSIIVGMLFVTATIFYYSRKQLKELIN